MRSLPEVQGEADQAKRILASMIASASVPPPPEIPESVGKVRPAAPGRRVCFKVSTACCRTLQSARVHVYGALGQ